MVHATSQNIILEDSSRTHHTWPHHDPPYLQCPKTITHLRPYPLKISVLTWLSLHLKQFISSHHLPLTHSLIYMFICSPPHLSSTFPHSWSSELHYSFAFFAFYIFLIWKSSQISSRVSLNPHPIFFLLPLLASPLAPPLLCTLAPRLVNAKNKTYFHRLSQIVEMAHKNYGSRVKKPEISPCTRGADQSWVFHIVLLHQVEMERVITN